MKRLVSLLLLAALAASMIVLPVSAEMKLADNTPEEIALMQRAVVETAAAYLAKDDRVQYGRDAMTVMNNRTTGIGHVSTGDAPETAGIDHILYTNCADFTYSVYYNTFGRGPADITARQVLVRNYNTYKSASDVDVVLKFGGTDGMTDRQAFWEQMQQVLQPGDLVNTVDWDIERGHSMLYVGDYLGDGKQYVIHSSGGDSGLMGDNHSKTVKLTTWDIFLGTKTFGLQNPKVSECTILRPIRVIDFDELTDAAKARLKYPLLSVDRTAEIYHYAPVQTGQTIAVALTVANRSDTPYKALEIVDPAPTGGVVLPETISAGGELTADGGVRWNLDVGAKGYTRCSYSVRVTGAIGETVSLPAGTVGGLPSRDFAWQVSGKPLDDALFREIRRTGAAEGMTQNTTNSDTAFVSTFYRQALGIELAFPDAMSEIVENLFTVISVEDAPKSDNRMFALRPAEELTPEYRVFTDMIIDKHLTGQLVNLGTHPDTQKPENRVMTYFAEAYQPGDIFLAWQGRYDIVKSDQVVPYVYLGSGKLAVPGEGGLRIVDFETSIERLGQANVVIALRPTQNRADLAADATPLSQYLPETPAQPEVPEVPSAPETPEAPAQPETPEAPAQPETAEPPETPETPAEPEPPETPAEPEAPAAPADKKAAPIGLIAGIGAAVVILAAVILLTRKRKP